MPQIQIVLVLLIFAAIVAVEMRDLLASIVALGVVGLGLSITFLFLNATDLAVVQIVVEILSFIILVRAIRPRREAGLVVERKAISATITLTIIVLFLFFISKALFDLPAFGNPAMRVSERYLQNGLKETGAANIVMAVLLDYRIFDSLGQIIILFAAVMGILSIIRKVGRKK